MKYYPICLRVAGRPCLVVGGGRVAEQKVDPLLEAGASTTVVSREITPRLAALVSRKALLHHARPYARPDLRGVFLVIAATDDERTQQQVVRDAQQAGVLVNVVDRPELCDFIMPSIMRRGDLLIATSTSGGSPALAKRIRRDLDALFGPEYELAIQVLRRVRQRLRPDTIPLKRRQIFSTLIESPLLQYLRDGQVDQVDRLLTTTTGTDISLASLGLELRRS